MPRMTRSTTPLALMMATALLASPSTAQTDALPPLLVEVACMKSTSSSYANLETAFWQPLHQKMVDDGKKSRWSLYRVLYGDRSTCDFYTVEEFRGWDQLNAERPFAETFAAVHPGQDWHEAMARTAAARSHVGTELWVWVDGVPPTDHKFVSVNQMRAAVPAEYVRHEREIWKPVHQALADAGRTAGWGLYRLDSPHGKAIPYNFGTVDYLQRLGPAPFDETLKSVHPDREPAELSAESLALRDHLLAQTWVLLATTE